MAMIDLLSDQICKIVTTFSESLFSLFSVSDYLFTKALYFFMFVRTIFLAINKIVTQIIIISN